MRISNGVTSANESWMSAAFHREKRVPADPVEIGASRSNRPTHPASDEAGGCVSVASPGSAVSERDRASEAIRSRSVAIDLSRRPTRQFAQAEEQARPVMLGRRGQEIAYRRFVGASLGRRSLPGADPISSPMTITAAAHAGTIEQRVFHFALDTVAADLHLPVDPTL